MGTFSLILLALAVIVGIIVLLALRKPDVFRVERRATIHAAPEVVFGHVNTIRAWEAFSPWQKRDPAMKQVYSGPESGVGASQAWEGNNQVGKGRMTITQSLPVEKIVFRLEFEKPFKATNTAEFTLTPSGGSTEVVWAMHGPANLMSKIMDVLMNMDKMCGRDFDAGLANLKAICEKG